MDWLKAHIHEVILPNLQGDLQEQTGIHLDESLGDFKIVAEPLDEDDEDCEEFEITIMMGDLLLVDACFLLEEVESGVLPFCKPEEDLTRDLIEAKLKSLRDKVIPVLREEFSQELAENHWDTKIAMLLNISPEVVRSATGMRSSGGYPPIILVFRHPEYDPDAFEVSTRIDPMASDEWIDWKSFMPGLNAALKAIGEEQIDPGTEPSPDSSPENEEREPSAEELEDEEISDIEGDATEGAPSATEAALTGNLLASLEASLGIKLTKGAASAVQGEDGPPPPSGKEKASSKKKAAPKKSAGASKKAPAKKKAAASKQAQAKKKAPAKKKAKRR